MEGLQKQRYHLLDSLRAFALLNMIAYHATFDIVYIFGVKIKWYMTDTGDLWQRLISFTFILLSGFCWQLGSHKLKRSLIVLGCSVIITVATRIFMPSQIVRFGVLSLLGSCMLLTVVLDHVYKRINPFVGFAIMILLYMAFENVNHGGIGIGSTWFTLPRSLYTSDFSAYIGFTPFGFRSSDYYPLLPSAFLYHAGYFLFGIFKKLDWLKYLVKPEIKPLEWIGRHSLMIYMLHQPIIYGVLWIIFKFI